MSTQAIFLSYASQDADAARRICDALRAAGLEVWFDQSELRGGDAWDASIRKQIKECALFIPIISANTNARSEGYFRLEWKLAVDRSHLMADDQAFLFPVVIDDIFESTARVPDRFRERQWSRLNDEESIAAFALRVKELLDSPPASENAGIVPAASMPVSERPPNSQAVKPGNPSARRFWLLGAAGGMVAIGGAITLAKWAPWQQGGAIGAATGKPAPGDPQLQRALQLIEPLDPAVADVVLAEDMVKTALTARPADAEATLAMARIQVYFLLRGFDRSEERFGQAKRFAERALALSATDPEAMVTMGTYLYLRRVDLPRAKKLLDDAIVLRPDESRYHRMRDNALAVTPGVTPDELIAAARKTADRFPQDALVQYELSRHYRNRSMLKETEHYLDRAIELGPVPNAIIQRARLKLFVDGDVAAMKTMMERIPQSARGQDRYAVNMVIYAAASGEFDGAMAALRAVGKPWIADFDYTGPTEQLAGEILLLSGKTELARLRFQEAAAEFDRHAADLSRNIDVARLKCWLLMRLGQVKESRTLNAQLFKDIRRPYRINLYANWLFHPMALQLLLGERANALALMREAVDFPEGRQIIRNFMRIDSRMVPFRTDPAIVALLLDPAAKP